MYMMGFVKKTKKNKGHLQKIFLYAISKERIIKSNIKKWWIIMYLGPPPQKKCYEKNPKVISIELWHLYIYCSIL